jgi:tetratricopeptide (TPR) repeat protein
MRVALTCLLAVAVVRLPLPQAFAAAPQILIPAAPPAPPPVQRARVLSTRDALDRYMRGDYQGALQGNPRLTRFDFNEAERWLSSGGAATAERRRATAALFALEYAGVRQSLLPVLLTWARGVLARQPPRPLEARWLRASIALAEGLDRWVFLVRGVPPPTVSGRRPAGPPPPVVGHIAHARGRFPDDPYFKMAEAVGAEVSASRPLDRLSAPPPQTGTGWDRVEIEMLESGGPRLAERTAALERAAALLEQLVSTPDLAADAHLRLGYVRLRQGQRDAALGHFDQIAASDANVRTRYLGHVLAGWSLGSVNRVNEAAIAYRAALRLVPRAQSATALLVALYLRHDQLMEAELASDEFLDPAPAPSDPWHAYFVGDYDAYPQLVTTLREALR